jgi:hypothetical protein
VLVSSFRLAVLVAVISRNSFSARPFRDRYGAGYGWTSSSEITVQSRNAPEIKARPHMRPQAPSAPARAFAPGRVVASVCSYRSIWNPKEP